MLPSASTHRTTPSTGRDWWIAWYRAGSVRQRYLRIVNAVQTIAAQHPGQTVVIVTHGGPLGDCYRHATAMPLEATNDFQLFNAAINRFTVVGEYWQLLNWSDTAHLDGVEMLGNWEGPR